MENFFSTSNLIDMTAINTWPMWLKDQEWDKYIYIANFDLAEFTMTKAHDIQGYSLQYNHEISIRSKTLTQLLIISSYAPVVLQNEGSLPTAFFIVQFETVAKTLTSFPL